MKLGNNETRSHRPDSKPFDHNDITLDSTGLQSANRIMKESQNRVLCASKDNEEDAGQVPYGLAESRFDCSKGVDDLENRNKDGVKAFASPYTISSQRLEALEKEPDYYMDKSVMECEVPELIVCYKEGSCNAVKDICVDEGVPSPDNVWFETSLDEKACCTFLSPVEDQNKQLLDEQMDIVMTLPDDFKSSAQNDMDEDFDIPCDSKVPIQRGDITCGALEKTAINASKDIFSATNGLSIQELGTENIHSKSSNEDSDEAVDANGLSMQELGAGTVHSKSSDGDSNEAAKETVQISSEKGSEGTALISVTEESNDSEKEVLVSPAEESNRLVDKLSDIGRENRSITLGLESLVPVFITRDSPKDGVRKHFEAQNMPVDIDDDEDTDMSDSDIVLGQAQKCLAPVITGREECPENGVCQCPETSNTSTGDDDIADSKIASGQAQQLVPVTIAREEYPENGVCRCPETSNASMVEDVNSDTQNASFHVHRGLGESSFSAVSHFSGLLSTSGPYSGNVSLRSESSTTSTRSFAFPVLESEWNSSPVRMAAADRRHLPKHRGWRHSLLCCRF